MPSWRSFYSGTKRQQVWTCVKSQVKQSRLSQAFHTSYTPLTNMTLENLQFWIGNTSSHGWFSIVMLVFGWVNVLSFKVKHLQNQIWKTGSKLLHQKSCTSIVHLSYLISIVSYPYISSLHMIQSPVNFANWQLFAKKTRDLKRKRSVSVKSVALELNHVEKTSLRWTRRYLKQVLRCDIFGRPSDPAGENDEHFHRTFVR